MRKTVRTEVRVAELPGNAHFCMAAASQTIDYNRVGITPIGSLHRPPYPVSDAAAIQGVIVIGNRHEKSASGAHAYRSGPSGAFLRFSAGIPPASVRRESIARPLNHFHCDEVPRLKPETLENLRSEYNHRSGVVPLSAV
jgi:hypothetical protein